jgi:alkylated DNA nucleotide flippase Atl1
MYGRIAVTVGISRRNVGRYMVRLRRVLEVPTEQVHAEAARRGLIPTRAAA